MCGIVGLINPARVPLARLSGLREGSAEDLCRGMVGRIAHRGPDQFGALIEEESFLGSARLSIRDIEHGAQPISNEDESVWVVYNGEIYDDDLHRERLRARGHHFRTRCDTEVLVHLYEDRGFDLTGELNGEYAFCLADRRRRLHVLCRDPFGTKPLYYRPLSEGAVLFASEIKPLLWATRGAPRISARALGQTLESWAVLPPDTPFEGIRQVCPGSRLIVDADGCREERHFHLDDQHSTSTESIEALLDKAVRRRLQSDVPVGVYLSGGLDSAIVAYLARSASASDLATFSVEFESTQFDEAPSQVEMQRSIGTTHHSVRISNDDIVDHFVPATLAAESIVFRSAFVPMFLLSRLVHDRGYRVVLSGEGADELFGGYDIFREAQLLSRWATEANSAPEIEESFARLYSYLPEFSSKNRRFLMAYYKGFTAQATEPFGGHQTRWSSLKTLRSLLSDPESSASPTADALRTFGQLDPKGLDGVRTVEILTLLHGYLLSTQGDRMASAHSVEVRLPYLDADLAQSALSKPVESFVGQNRGKEVLYSAFADKLPRAIIEKPKQPYLAPDSEAFFASPNQGWRDFLTVDALASVGIINVPEARALLATLEAGAGSGRGASRRLSTGFFALLSSSILHHEVSSHLDRGSPSIAWTKLVRIQGTADERVRS